MPPLEQTTQLSRTIDDYIAAFKLLYHNRGNQWFSSSAYDGDRNRYKQINRWINVVRKKTNLLTDDQRSVLDSIDFPFEKLRTDMLRSEVIGMLEKCSKGDITSLQSADILQLNGFVLRLRNKMKRDSTFLTRSEIARLKNCGFAFSATTAKLDYFGSKAYRWFERTNPEGDENSVDGYTEEVSGDGESRVFTSGTGRNSSHVNNLISLSSIRSIVQHEVKKGSTHVVKETQNALKVCAKHISKFVVNKIYSVLADTDNGRDSDGEN